MKNHYIIPIFVPHKGCPHSCVFCNQKEITGQMDDVDDVFVEREIAKYLNTIPKSASTIELSFFGGSFTGIPIDEMISLLKPAKRALDEGKIDAIRLSTRPDYIDDFILQTLKKYGASIIELGVQSMDEEVLSKSRRGHSVEDVYRASSLIKEYGFRLGLQMMVGLPGDDFKKDTHTADEFIKINPEMVRIYPSLVIKNTMMEQMYKKGEYKPLSVDEAVEICTSLYLKFVANDINVIRMGLQPTENINLGKDVISGPFHPSFRELVESVLMNDMILYSYKKLGSASMDIFINPKSISKLYADKKRYFNEMLNMIERPKVKVKAEEGMPYDTITIHTDDGSLNMSIKDYSNIVCKKRNF
jgi:histone acetyltransferase (RNA polymerase elongator complex component)